MSWLTIVLVIISLFETLIGGEVKFCDTNRPIQLGGVFRHRDIVYAYSWNPTEPDAILANLVWTYKMGTTDLSLTGTVTTVNKLFPGLPLFKSGIGLSLKCDKSDTKCNDYEDMVFMFFQSNYKVFKFSNNAFTPVGKDETLMWGLKGEGYLDAWTFNAPITKMATFDIDGAVFVTGYQPQLFVVWASALYVSPADIKAAGLKWTKMGESDNLRNVLGGFLASNELMFNKNEGKTNTIYKYDLNGKDNGKESVWKYFGCDPSVRVSAAGVLEVVDDGSKGQRNKNIATIIVICVIVAIVLTDIITALFWIAVYRKKNANSA